MGHPLRVRVQAPELERSLRSVSPRSAQVKLHHVLLCNAARRLLSQGGAGAFTVSAFPGRETQGRFLREHPNVTCSSA